MPELPGGKQREAIQQRFNRVRTAPCVLFLVQLTSIGVDRVLIPRSPIRLDCVQPSSNPIQRPHLSMQGYAGSPALAAAKPIACKRFAARQRSLETANQVWLRTPRSQQPTAPSQAIERARDAQPAAIQHVRIHHRRADVGVPEKLLHRPGVGTRLQQVRRQRIPECLPAHNQTPSCGVCIRHGRATTTMPSSSAPMPCKSQQASHNNPRALNRCKLSPPTCALSQSCLHSTLR